VLNDFDIRNPGKVLVICAHPDDPEFSAGGTIAAWTMRGAEVRYAVVTDGSKGSSAAGATAEMLASLRKSEQLAAARRLGVAEVAFLGYPDGEVYNTPGLRRDLVRQIRLHQPRLVVTHDPTARLIGRQRINHPDHLAVGDTALAAVFPLARDRLNFPEHEKEGLAPHKVLQVLLMMTDQPDFTFDISQTIEAKIAALHCHQSQIGDPHDLAVRIKDRAAEYANGFEFSYGEAFRAISLLR
jgi:LmbE family N-acetylglucosaminyl deacetylase